MGGTKLSVIYKIINKVNDKFYIGSSLNFNNRVRGHLHKLRNNNHHSIILQNSWNKYGEENFIFEILEYCEKKDLIVREQYYIDNLKPFYNICKTAYSTIGRVTSEETKEKLRKTSTGKKHTEETKEKLRKTSTGRKHTEETKEKLRKINTGKKQSKETIEKRVNKIIGRKNTEETKQKMSNSHKGKKMSKEAVEKSRQANKGRVPWNKGKKLSEETKQKISLSSKGKKLSEETKQKISLATSGDKNPFYGKKHSEETKNKIKNTKKTKKMMSPLQLLQTKIGVKPDGSFGPLTLKATKNYYKLTDEQVSHFIGQVSHETGEFRLFSENLNYSVKGLQSIFGKYFPGNLEESYARQPEKIANRVYGNRMGNGDEESGDGWKYRGRGALQLTGKNNYKAFSEYLEKPEILDNPDLVSDEYAFESALFFFDKNKLWSICDKGVTDETIKQLTKRINGGYNGLEHRTELTKKYYKWLKK